MRRTDLLLEFHRKLRSQGQVHSILDDIPGVGPARRKALDEDILPAWMQIKNADCGRFERNFHQWMKNRPKSVYNFFTEDSDNFSIRHRSYSGMEETIKAKQDYGSYIKQKS